MSRAAVSLAVLLAIGGALVVTAWTRSARADFDRHYQRGLTLYQKKDYEGAVAEMQAAYSERQLPRILLNIGQAYKKMGKAREALAYYERYLSAEPDAPAALQAEIRSYIAQTRVLIEASPVPPASGTPGSEPGPTGWNRDTGQIQPDYAAQLKAQERNRPIYKRPWFWAVVGGGAAVTIAIAVGVGVAKSRELPSGITVIQF